MTQRRFATVSFLSDFGYDDEFAGVVAAIVRDFAPHADVITLTHGIAPFDVRAGSLALARAIGYVPSGVVLAAVDSDASRPIAVEVGNGEAVIVGPDNGLLAPAVAMAGGAGRAALLTNPAYRLESPGRLFVCRDVLAPAAAHLCNGVALEDLGELIDPDLLLPGVIPLSREDDGMIAAEVLWVDRYGNCQINVGPDELAGWPQRIRIIAGSESTVRVATMVDRFDDITVGAVGVLTDATGMLALACHRRSAADELGVAAGDQITLSPVEGNDAALAGAPVANPVRRREH